MTKYIEEKAALNEIARFIGYIDQDMIHRIQMGLTKIPAADVVERKKGKWIYDCERMAGDGWTYRQHHCTVCGFQSAVSHYCPNCGTVLKEGDNG